MKTEVNHEDKVKISARAFYNDNRDQYKDYKQAEKEMTNVSKQFLDFVCESNIVRKHGHTLMMSPTGQLINIRVEDEWVEHVSLFDEEEITELREKFRIAQSKFPSEAKITTEDVFTTLGWKRL